MKNKERSRALTSAAHVAVAGVVFAFSLTLFGVVVYGVRTASLAAQSVAESLHSKLEDQQLFIKAVRMADVTKKERAELVTHVIAKDEGAAFIAGIEALGERAGVPVKITSITTTRGAEGAPGLLTFTVSFEGSYAACLRFAGLIETMPISISVPRVEFGYDDSTNEWGGILVLSALSFDTQ